MLAYSPVHHQIFDRLGRLPLVMTSAKPGRLADRLRDRDLVDRRSGDAVLTHDRPIHVP